MMMMIYMFRSLSVFVEGWPKIRFFSSASFSSDRFLRSPSFVYFARRPHKELEPHETARLELEVARKKDVGRSRLRQ